MLRLHADVALAGQIAGSASVEVTERVACLLARLAVAIDLVVAGWERGKQ